MAYKKLLALGSALVVMLGLFTGCGTVQPEEEVQKPDKLAHQETAVSVMLVDPSTGDVITGEEIQISIAGEDAENVVDGTGNPITSTTTEEGTVTLYVRNAPADFRVLASADGYFSSGQVLSIEPGAHAVNIYLVKRSDPPEGIQTSQEQLEAGNSGEISDPVTIETDQMDDTDTKVTVDIADNTGFKDEDDNFVTGTITSDLAHFSSTAEKALLSFPGGFTAEIGTGDNIEKGIIVTSGFFALTMENQNGEKVRSFTDPLSVTIDIPGSEINAETGEPVAEGDQIRIFSYDEETGKWQFEDPAELSGPDANGNLQATFRVDHPAYWSAGWWIRNDEYAQGVKFNLEGAEGKNIRLLFTRASDAGWTKEVYSLGKDTVTVPEIPNGFDVEAVAYFQGDEVGSINILEGAASDDATIDFPITINANTSDVTVVVSEVCVQDNSLSTLLASSRVSVVQDGKFVTAALTDEDGEAFLGGLVVGETYTIIAQGRRGRDYATETVVISSDDVTIELEIQIECQPITGGSN